MNEVWKRIFTEYIESYNAINTLEKNSITDEEDADKLRLKLLYKIIATMRSEIEG